VPMAELWRDSPEIRVEIEAVRALLLREIESGSPELAAPLSELGAAEGKMLRPAFLVISSRFGTPDRDRIRRMAAAVEMFHLATLVHDDVIDNSKTRRRRPTLHSRRGARTAVLAGDYLFSRSFLVAAARLDNLSVQRLASVISHVCASEIAQTEDVYRPSTSMRRYRRRIAGKTAALFAASCHIGASESGCPKATTQSLTRAGYGIGMAFQIVDDILDFSGDAEALGKPLLQDLREGVFTLPVVHALRRDPAALGRMLERLEGRGSPRMVRGVAEAVRSLGGLDAARLEVDRYTTRALREIASLPDRAERRILAAAAEALRSRTA
jgi:heptaprenyl diphosphate synthase